VDVEVDEPGRYNQAGAVDDPRSSRLRLPGPEAAIACPGTNPGDAIAIDQDIGRAVLARSGVYYPAASQQQ
jgi:hypothetical protein